MVNNNHPVDIPKAYTVSYFDEVEWNKDLTVEEIKGQQELVDLQNQLGEFEKAVGPCPVCQQPERWAYLKVGCPAIGCPKKDKPANYWYHWCGGRAEISNKAFIRCENCSNAKFHMSEWNFICSTHISSTDNSVNYRSFSKCLASLIYSDDYSELIADVTCYMACKRDQWPKK